MRSLFSYGSTVKDWHVLQVFFYEGLLMKSQTFLVNIFFLF